MAKHNKSFTPIKSKTMPAGQYGSIEPTVTELPVGGENPFRDLPTVTRATRKPMLDAPIFRRKGALALTALAVVVGVAAISGIATGASSSRNNAHAHTPRLRGEGAMVSAPDSEDADAILDTDLHKKSHRHHHDDKKSHHHGHDKDKDHHDKGWHKSKVPGHGEQPEQPEQTEAVTAPKPGSTQDAHWGTDVFDWRKYAGGVGFGGAAAGPAPVADTARTHTHTHTTHAHDDHDHKHARSRAEETTTTTTTTSAVPVEADKPGSRKNEHWGTDVFDWRVYTGGRAPGQDAAAAQEKADEKKLSTHDHHHDHDVRRSKHGHKVHLDSLSDTAPADLVAEAPELVDEEGEGPLVEEADLARRGHSTRAHDHDDDKKVVEETTTTTTTTSTTPETDPPGEEKNNHWGTDKYDWRTHTGGQAPGQAAAEKGKEAQAKQEKEDKTKSKAKDSHKD